MLNYSKEIGKMVTIMIALIMIAPAGLTFTGGDIILADFPPTVTLNTPGSEEQIYVGSIIIDWLATDAEEDDALLDITIEYSPDGGTNWYAIMSGVDNNNPPYSWDTVAAGVSDGVNYLLFITATDNASQSDNDLSYVFSIDNTPDDRWYLQIESMNLGSHLDLDMKPSESAVQEISVNVSAPGVIPIQSFASEYVAPGLVDLAGDWTFSIYAKGSSNAADGNLYANVYADDGSTSRMIFTTDYDDENINPYLDYHEFNWIYSVPTGTLIYLGEQVVVEIMLYVSASSGPFSHNHYAYADIPVLGNVSGDYSLTLASDDQRETIDEVLGSNGTMVAVLDEDFFGNPNFPPGWKVINGGNNGGPADTWTTKNFGNRTPVPPITEPFAIADGAFHGDGMNEQLITPSLDFTLASSVILEFDQYFNSTGYDDATVKYRVGGGVWSVIIRQVNPPFLTHLILNLTPWLAGRADVEICFDYWGGSPTENHWWIVDNVLVKASFVGTSVLEHKWTVDLLAGEDPFEFFLEARRPNTPDGDDFVFAYSTDDISYTKMVTVDRQQDNLFTYSLPSDLAGTIYIRVGDTDRISGVDITRIEIDQMFISSVHRPLLTIGFDNYTTPSFIEPTFALSQISYLCIQDAPGGIGNNVTTHSMTTDETYTVWAIGYDTEWNYVSDIQANWTNTLNVQTATSSTSFTLDPSAPGSGTITAVFNATLSDTTGLITVTLGLLDYIIIRDSPGGFGNEINAYSMTTDETLTIWASSYDADGNYIGDVNCDWSTNGTLDSQGVIGVDNFTFDPSTAGTSGFIIAINGTTLGSAGLITVEVGLLDNIVIKDAPGGIGNNVTTHTMTTDETFTVWSSGYDAEWNYISEIPANWTNTLNAQTATSSTVFTLDPTAPDTGTITADFNGTISDTTGLITVTVGLLDNIVIRDSPGGFGNEVNAYSMTTDDVLTVWAAGYDADGNYIDDFDCNWSTNGTLDFQSALKTNNFTFDPSTAGTSGFITAINGTTIGSAGLITVEVGLLDHIIIEDAPGGSGSEVGDVQMVLGETLSVYSAGYDADDNYIGDILCNWTTTGTLNLTTATSSSTFTFVPASTGEAGAINATFNTTIFDETGLINVSDSGIDYIVIEDGLGNEIITHIMDTTETFTVWAIGYNFSLGYIAPVDADWTTTGTLDLQTATISQSITFDPIHAPTSGTIEAAFGILWDSTGLITVNPGPLTYLCIQDSSGGIGTNITTHAMTTDGTLTVWAIGYDAEWNYISDVNCDWTTTGTLDLQTATGVDTFTFSPITPGMGTIVADNLVGHTDSTGLITVGFGALNYIMIRDASGGGGSEVGGFLMVIGETLSVYSACYDADNNYIGDVPCDWTTTGTLNLTTATTSPSFTFEPAVEGETGTINATFNTTIYDETGLINVIGHGIDVIIIVDDLGSPVNNYLMDTTETLRVWAMGWNISEGEIGPVDADWTTTGTLDLQTATASQSFTFDPIHAPTSGSIEAQNGSLWDSTLTISVIPGPLTYLCIQDAPGGTGANVTTHTMTTGETFTVWSIGYDAEWNYISDVNCDWTTTGTLDPQSAAGVNTFTFSPVNPGNGTIIAFYNVSISDETGLITVIEPIPTFDIDITLAAGSGGWILISFPSQIEGDPLTIIVDAVDEGAGLVTWDIVQWYDPTSPSGNEWKTTATFKPPPLNTFNYVNNTYSFWIHITNYGDGNLTIQGTLAVTGEWASIELIAGWNLVGYPFPVAQPLINTFGILINLDMPVETYDPADPYRLRTADVSTEDQEPGHGYWLHVAADEIFSIQCP